MSKKKLMWIFILIVFVFIIVGIAIFVKPRDTSNDNSVAVKKVTDSKTDNNSDTSKTEEKSDKIEYKRTTLDDGILYSENGEKLTSDKIIGTEYFDTTINDMYLYPENYSGKNIEIEGMYLNSAKGYTFVGRYSSVSTCAYCSGGLSYIEYEFNGNIQEKLEDQKTWLKLVGKWKRKMMNFGTEEEPYYDYYYYLDVLNFEIMNTRGEDTVKN